MSEHYYTGRPSSESRETAFETAFAGETFRFVCDRGVFSINELDEGTRILLSPLPPLAGRILDLGCGWGPVGVILGCKYPRAQIVMSDVNERAAALAEKNLALNGVKNARVVVSDGLEKVEGTFDAVITNPPIRAGKQVIYRLFAESAEKLNESGAVYIVIRRQQGAESALKYLKTVFAQVETVEKSGGFWVIRCDGGKSDEV